MQIIGRIESAFGDPKEGPFRPWEVHPLRERAEYHQDVPQVNWDAVRETLGDLGGNR